MLNDDNNDVEDEDVHDDGRDDAFFSVLKIFMLSFILYL